MTSLIMIYCNAPIVYSFAFRAVADRRLVARKVYRSVTLIVASWTLVSTRTRLFLKVPPAVDSREVTDPSSTPGKRFKSTPAIAADRGTTGRPVPKTLPPTERVDRAATLTARGAEITRI